MRKIVFATALLLLATFAEAAPQWGAKTSSPANTPLSQLQPGQWIWGGDNKRYGPMAIVVSLTEQRAYVYRNGLLIGVTTVSTGKPGHETPTGVFTILQKDKDHHSNVYDNAAMPYMERLTWGGVALHAGGLPGYPESHGCVHLPTEFARLLFDASNMGMTVVVAKEREAPVEIAHPSAMLPIDPATGAPNELPRLSEGEAFRWTPESSPQGPVSILISAADRRVLVFRNGVEIGRARIDIRDPQKPLGVHAFIVKEGAVAGESIPRWTAIGIPGNEGESGKPLSAEAMHRVAIPPAFQQQVQPFLVPGVVMLVTDAQILPQTTGVKQQVLDSDPPDVAVN